MSKYEIVTINNKLVSIDLSELIKKENIFFNATQIAQQHGKDVRNYTTSKQFNDYCAAVEAMRKISATDLLRTKRGGSNQGTWLHNSVAIDFARWCSPEFAVAMDIKLENIFQEEKHRKQDRSLAKLEYPELTDAIQEFLITGKDSDKWLYSNEADLINSIVLGCKSKKYCDLNGIDRVQLRDNLNNGQIGLIQQLQKFDTALIQAGLEYSIRKEKLNIRYAQLVAKLLK